MTPWGVLVVAAALLQAAWVAKVSLWGAQPNLVLVVVVGWSLLRAGREGLLWAMVGGVMLDLFSAAPLGTFTVALLITALAATLLDETPLRASLPLATVAMFLLSPLFHFVAMVLMQSLGWDVAWANKFTLLPAAATADALLMALLFRPLQLANRLAGERPIEWS